MIHQTNNNDTNTNRNKRSSSSSFEDSPYYSNQSQFFTLEAIQNSNPHLSLYSNSYSHQYPQDSRSSLGIRRNALAVGEGGEKEKELNGLFGPLTSSSSTTSSSTDYESIDDYSNRLIAPLPSPSNYSYQQPNDSSYSMNYLPLPNHQNQIQYAQYAPQYHNPNLQQWNDQFQPPSLSPMILESSPNTASSGNGQYEFDFSNNFNSPSSLSNTGSTSNSLQLNTPRTPYSGNAFEQQQSQQSQVHYQSHSTSNLNVEFNTTNTTTNNTTNNHYYSSNSTSSNQQYHHQQQPQPQPQQYQLPSRFPSSSPHLPLQPTFTTSTSSLSQQPPLRASYQPQIPITTTIRHSKQLTKGESGPLTELETAASEVLLAGTRTGAGAGSFVYKLYQ